MSFLTHLTDIAFWLSNPWLLVVCICQVWMLIDAVRREEWLWAVFIVMAPIVSTALYYFFVYRHSASDMQGFELPGAGTRARIKELEGQIHHLDKAHHHLQLGDVYFRKGNFVKAEHCYRAALEREPGDIDTRAHLGQALLRQKRPQEAKPLLQSVCTENPRHDYGHSMMAYAETLTALGEIDAAIQVWQKVLENNSYARARVQLAELHIQRKQFDEARAGLREVLIDYKHLPKFQRQRERVWVRRAKSLIGKV
jgi:cytochrome c-type biogenesis protein CcmH/NrfG